MFNNGIIKRDEAAIIPKNNVSINDLVDAFYKNRSPKTIEAYHGDLSAFAVWCGMSEAKEAIQMLITLHHGAANLKVLSYKDHLQNQGLAPKTINRRIAALRSVIKLANTLGLISWSIQVENMKDEKVRDTAGPGLGNVKLILNKLSSRTDIKGIRDYAIIRMLFDLALRRGEVSALELDDYDSVQKKIRIKGKGRKVKETLSIPSATAKAIDSYISLRGNDSGFLFLNLDRAGKGSGLTGSGIWGIVKKIGLEVALIGLHPHSFRHSGITTALDVTGGDLRKVMSFSRHKNFQTLQMYDDKSKTFAGEVANKVSETV